MKSKYTSSSQLSLDDQREIAALIQNVNSAYRITELPVTEEAVSQCNNALRQLNLPTLPVDYIDFLKICNGFQCNGMSLFGCLHDEIITQTLQWSVHKESDIFLVIGRIDDDIYIYNSQSCRYECCDINDFEVWDSYPSFPVFFIKEVKKWLYP